ncbi:hypothetical protein RJ640_005647 [Escallonia rubra]|uniref:Uncharacterized protein n=1 Tax=Escallonia rubra TaxID=112253 RepID=A0AA88SJK7_9ASTE|nr:hypothetical protein RJ640_005647 [Escallonia rubra]
MGLLLGRMLLRRKATSQFYSHSIRSKPPSPANGSSFPSNHYSSFYPTQDQNLMDRMDAANELASLARENDRNKKIIVDEGGIAPLLRLLKEGASPEVQLVAATALYNIGTDQEC